MGMREKAIDLHDIVGETVGGELGCQNIIISNFLCWYRWAGNWSRRVCGYESERRRGLGAF